MIKHNEHEKQVQWALETLASRAPCLTLETLSDGKWNIRDRSGEIIPQGQGLDWKALVGVAKVVRC